MNKRKGNKILSVKSDELHEAVSAYVGSRPFGETDISEVMRTALHEWLLKNDPKYAAKQKRAR